MRNSLRQAAASRTTSSKRFPNTIANTTQAVAAAVQDYHLNDTGVTGVIDQAGRTPIQTASLIRTTSFRDTAPLGTAAPLCQACQFALPLSRRTLRRSYLPLACIFDHEVFMGDIYARSGCRESADDNCVHTQPDFEFGSVDTLCARCAFYGLSLLAAA
jgi:hypothetical protein